MSPASARRNRLPTARRPVAVQPVRKRAYQVSTYRSFWYSTTTDWRRLERWAIIATIAAYVAALVSLVVFLGEILLLEGSPAQRIFHGIANYLGRLGDVGGGSIVAVILFALVGGVTYVLILKAIDKINENRERRARERAEWEAASRAQGRAEGHAQGRAEIIEQLRNKGVNVDDLLPPDESESEPPANP